MAYIRIFDQSAAKTHEFEVEEVRLGRDPQLEIVATGDDRKVVSAYHARVFYKDSAWWIEDRGSRNGTFLDEAPVAQGVPAKLTRGAWVRLGRMGPSYRVEAISERRVSMTMAEATPAVSSTDPTLRMARVAPDEPRREPDFPLPPRPAAPPEAAAQEPQIVLLQLADGTRFEAAGRRVRIGRGRECQFRPVGPGDTSISRVHAEIEVTAEGSVVVRDAGSRNGTLVNGTKIEADCALAKGDRIGLGPAGPVLLVEEVRGGALLERSEAPREPIAVPQRDVQAPSPSVPRRSFGGKGATVFFRDMFEESTRKSKARLRWVVWAFVALLVVSVGVMYWVSERRVRETEAQLAEQGRQLAEQQAVADSLRLAAAGEVERLRQEFESARDQAAPVAVLDSLRDALNEARERTDFLEAALGRAQESLNQQLALGDSLRRQATSELARLRTDLSRASGTEASAALLDSLRSAIRATEERAASVEAQMRAVRGADFASVSQANQGAIGLVTVFSGSSVFDGSGFMLTRSGYFVTNRHVVIADDARPDSLFVTMANQRRSLRAELVAVGESYGPDLALILVRGYSGAYVRRVDWTGTNMRQGEPAALIGFPAGAIVAMDASRAVLTSMSAGIFSKVTPEIVQFDGFTVGGSSGSPIFNASGEVVAVHRSGLREAAGLGFAVPIVQILPLLPQQVKAELGLQ